MVDYSSRLDRQYSLLAQRAGDDIHLTDANAIEHHAHAYDPSHRRVKPPTDGQSRDDTFATSTVKNRLQDLQQVAMEADTPIVAQLADGLNDLLDTWHGEIATGTLRQRQLAVRKFIWHCGVDDDLPDVPADHTQIFVDKQPDTSVDKAELLDWDDIEALRDACRNSRDRAFIEMLLYTGQRITALATLRIKDVYPDDGNGTFRLNPEYVDDGLKGADGRRPLLGSVAALREWLANGHPDPDNPDACVFTQLPQYVEDPDVEDPLTDSTFRALLNRLENRADVSKPCNPHNFRHTFVTIAYKEYGLDKDYIKKLIGHDDGSTVMETTYRHLDDDDTIEKTEVAFGIRDEESESPLTPSACPTCGTGLGPDDKACANCGMVFTPDAHEVKQQLEEDIYESAKQINDPETQEALDTLRNLLRENPELVDELTE